MNTDQPTQLQFTVYDQLKVWYNIWYHFSSAMGRAAHEYKKTGHITTQIAWEEGAGHLTAIRENIDKMVRDCQFSKEIEQNILMIDTSNKGVFYLNKLAKLINPYSLYRANNYLEHICNAPAVGHSKITDWDTYNTYQLEVQNFSTAFGRVEDEITSILSESVWYQQCIDLIKVEGYRSGIIPAANARPEIIPQLLTAPADQEPGPTEPVRKSRKKEKLTHKQQMVLVQLLGLDKHPLLINLKPRERGTILGELLNRSVDDTENMLHAETSKGDDKLNWNTEYQRGQVRLFLQKNGVNLTD